MYTTDHLIQDCVGQFIEKQPYSINRSSLLNDRQYCQVWTCLLQWTEKQIKRGNSFIIPHFGLIKCNDKNKENEAWTCFVESSYITEHNAKLGTRTPIDSISQVDLHNSPGIKCHISSLIQYSPSLSESQIQVGLKHIFSKLAQQIQRSATSTKNYADIDTFEPHLKIIINFGWGYLSCSDGVMDFIFTMEEPLIINPSIPNGLRHIPKQYLQSTASLLTVASVPSGVKISNPSQSGTSECSQMASVTQQLEYYRQKYKLPVDSDHDNPLIHLASSNTIPESSHEKSQYPPVLSEFSRTLGSSYCTHTNYEAPSSKIGLFYTPTASLYRINTDQKKIEYTDYLPFFQSHPERYYARNSKKLLEYEVKYRTQHADDSDEFKVNDTESKSKSKMIKMMETDVSNVSALDLDIATSCKRYHEYIHNRMPHDFIPPIHEELIAKILSKLEPDLTLISQDRVEEILEENLEEIQGENLMAGKQAILDYILRNNNERVRLNIVVPPHHIEEWGYSPLPFSAPLSWGQRLQDSWTLMNAQSYFVNRGIIGMLSLWENYKHYRLFGTPSPLPEEERMDLGLKVPVISESTDTTNEMSPNGMSSNGMSSNGMHSKGMSPINENVTMGKRRNTFLMPMTIQEFRDQQEEHLEYVRNIFVNNWYTEVVSIMKKYVEENQLDSSELSTLKLFNAIAAFMSRQLCEIVYKSLEELVTFFEKYLGAPTAVSCKPRKLSDDNTRKQSVQKDEVENDANDENSEESTPANNSSENDSEEINDDDQDNEAEEEMDEMIDIEIENVLDIKAVPLSKARGTQPLWKIGMELSRDGIDFEIPLEEIDITVNDMIENIISCFEGISCVEAKIFGLLENVPSLSVYIDEKIKRQTRNRCLEITSTFVTELQYLQDMYSVQFSPLFEANDVLTTKLADIDNMDKDASLMAFKAEIEKYEVIREEVSQRAHSRLRIGLFEVECQSINGLIINHAQDLKNGITNHVAKQLIEKAQKLVMQYEDGSKVLLKKPERAQELVALIQYIERFEGGELEHCQAISDEIGKELKFLFETDHSLSHDLLRSVGRVSDWNKKIIQHKVIADENRVTQRQFIETKVSEQYKQFEQKTKKMYQVVEDLQLLSEIRDTSRIEHLKAEIGPIEEEKEHLAQQQELLGVEVAEFKICGMLELSFLNFLKMYFLFFSGFEHQPDHPASSRSGPV